MYLNVPTKRIFRKRDATPSLLDYAYYNRRLDYFNDVTIKSGNILIPANRIVLSCYCRFFEKLFKSRREEAKKNLIEIKQVDGMTMNRLIEYIYIGCININGDNVLGLLAGAHHLELDEVKGFCFEFLLTAISTNNCLLIYKEAFKYENFDLKQKVYKFMSENFNKISKTKDFKNLSYFDLFPCLYNLNRKLVKESVLCKSIIDWTMNDKASRQKWFQNRLIRFVDVMQLPYIVLQKIICEKLIEEDEDRLRLVQTKMNEIWNNQKIISIGGFNTKTEVIEVWNPHDWTSFSIPDLPFFRYCHCSLKLKMFVYCIGGKRDDDDVTNEAWSLDLNEDKLKWKQMKSMKVKRERFGSAILDDVIVACGGSDGKNVLASCEAYFLYLNKWKMLKSMTQKRHRNSLVTLDGYLYAIGGWFDGNFLSSVERLHGLDGLWEKFSASLKTPRSDFASVTYNNMIYVMGGRSVNDQKLRSVEMLDPSSGCWIFCENMNRVRSDLDACVFQNKIFVVGGGDENRQTVYEIESFDNSSNRWEKTGDIDNELCYHKILVISEV